MTANFLNVPFILLIVTMFIVQLGVGLVIPVFPQFIRELGLSAATLGYLVSAMGIAQLAFSPLAGRLADRWGRKAVLMTGIFLFSAAQALFGAADEIRMLLLSRLLTGIGIAFTTPAILAYVADVTSEQQRGRGLGWTGAAMSLGIVVGPGVGGYLAEYGVRLPFYAAALVSALALLLGLWLLPETLPSRLKDVKEPKTGLLGQLADSLQAPYRGLLLLVFVLTFGLVIVEVVFGLYVDAKYGFTPQDIAMLLTAGGIVSAAVQAVLLDWLLARHSEGAIIRSGLLLSAAALGLLMLPGSFYYILAVTALFILCTSLIRPAVNTLLSKQADGEQGFIAGLNTAYTSLGIIAGPALGGVLFDLNMELPYACGIILLLVSLALPLGKAARTPPI